MLAQYVTTALIIGPIVWLFFYLYFHAKKAVCRRILFAGILYGACVGGLLTLVSFFGQWSIFR